MTILYGLLFLLAVVLITTIRSLYDLTIYLIDKQIILSLLYFTLLTDKDLPFFNLFPTINFEFNSGFLVINVFGWEVKKNSLE